MILLYVALFFLLLVGILVVIYYNQTNKRHRERRDEANKLIEEYKNIPVCLKNTYKLINQRRYEHVMTFFNFQLINKVSGFLSVILSLITFLSGVIKYFNNFINWNQNDDLAALAISFLSILCVITALYASPNRRVVEYISAWRIDERAINEMTAEMDTYQFLTVDESEKKAKEYMSRVSTAEDNMKSDED